MFLTMEWSCCNEAPVGVEWVLLLYIIGFKWAEGRNKLLNLSSSCICSSPKLHPHAAPLGILTKLQTFSSFLHYRMRCAVSAPKGRWVLLSSITPPNTRFCGNTASDLLGGLQPEALEQCDALWSTFVALWLKNS